MTKITEQFALRLQPAMINAGHASQRSTSGIDIHQLVDITGYSAQICRKYLRGEAMPDPMKLHEIAKKLGVSPGWLLFGNEAENPAGFPHQYLHIHKDILHAIFKKADILYKQEGCAIKRADYLVALAQEISELKVDAAQSNQIIDIALSSATHFHKTEKTEVMQDA